MSLMYMPVIDHRSVANLAPGDDGWVVGRALVCGGGFDLGKMWDNATLDGWAHVYPKQYPGVNVHVYRFTDGSKYFIKYFPPDKKGYIPYFVYPNQIIGIGPVEQENDYGQVHPADG